jgi:glycosyltransferase involved in cell wall biosynthesis
LSAVIGGLLRKGYKIDLYTSSNGVLSELSHENLNVRYSFYKFHDNRALTFLLYLLVQAYWFCICFKYVFSGGNTIFYINTILPVGPALFAFLTGKKLIFHCHENPDEKSRVYKILASIMKRTADKIICVSDYQLKRLRTDKGTVIPNAIPDKLMERGRHSFPKYDETPGILMLSSLKKYKGVYEFVELAKHFRKYRFILILNAGERETELLKREASVPSNMTVYSRQKDVSPYYSAAHLLLNLSIPEHVVETFGLTVTEAMSFGLPAIVPPVGGIAELVIDGYNGFKVHPLDRENLYSKIEKIFESEETYLDFVRNAKKESRKYGEATAIAETDAILKAIRT